ncbi:MAG: carbon storage regulator [Defluviitaleaceae bacterium]|nr:carbon storage regulator [Defluviitaleaceae bacterium]
MLHVTIGKGDYVMIGDIRVGYGRNDGKGAFVIGIDAPKDMKISRKSLYEDGVERQAAEGDQDAQMLLAALHTEHEQRRRASGIRRAKQQYHRDLALQENN